MGNGYYVIVYAVSVLGSGIVTDVVCVHTQPTLSHRTVVRFVLFFFSVNFIIFLPTYAVPSTEPLQVADLFPLPRTSIRRLDGFIYVGYCVVFLF